MALGHRGTGAGFSWPHSLAGGVLQGAVFPTAVFSFCMPPLPQLFQGWGDDNQLCLTMEGLPGSSPDILDRGSRLRQSLPEFNTAKTEVLDLYHGGWGGIIFAITCWSFYSFISNIVDQNQFLSCLNYSNNSA